MGAGDGPRQRPAAGGLRARPGERRLLARNAWAGDFAGRVAFADVGLRPHSVTADRTEFLGATAAAPPAALGRGQPVRPAPALDPCAALRVEWELLPGEAKEVVFVLGQAERPDEARRLLRVYRAAGRRGEGAGRGSARWDRVPGRRPGAHADPALDLLVNRWLLYQVLGCRVWGRSAFYQSGGAYGFRDQLQDVMALVYGAPPGRGPRSAGGGRQFEEGDVQHWWHPPAGRGVRTRITDDLLFLPLVVCHYVDDDRRRRPARRARAVPAVARSCGRSRRRTTACPR